MNAQEMLSDVERQVLDAVMFETETNAEARLRDLGFAEPQVTLFPERGNSAMVQVTGSQGAYFEINVRNVNGQP